MVEVDKLVKHFGAIKAVRGVSFKVGKGEVLGFLGPNGAGKSTTMKMITCFLPPTEGTARVNGFDIHENPLEVRRQIGYLPESAPLYDDMTVASFLAFAASVRGYDGAERDRRVDAICEKCQIKGVRHQPIHTLSKGFRQRVCFAQALIHDPPVLILDEPTDGLDPNQKQYVRSLITEMKGEKIIILSTHILEEVDSVCTRAIIISEGVIKADGSPDELRRQASGHGAVILTVAAAQEAAAKAALGSVEGVVKVETARIDGGEVRLRAFAAEGKKIGVAAAACLRDRGIQTVEFAVEAGRLDEVFRKITRTE